MSFIAVISLCYSYFIREEHCGGRWYVFSTLITFKYLQFQNSNHYYSKFSLKMLELS